MTIYVREDTALRSNSLPVEPSGANWQLVCRRHANGLAEGELVQCKSEMHVHNANNYLVNVVTEIRFGPEPNIRASNDTVIAYANGLNLGAQGYGADKLIIPRFGDYVFPDAHPDSMYWKLFAHAKSTAAQTGDAIDITGGGQTRVLLTRFKPY